MPQVTCWCLVDARVARNKSETRTNEIVPPLPKLCSFCVSEPRRSLADAAGRAVAPPPALPLRQGETVLLSIIWLHGSVTPFVLRRRLRWRISRVRRCLQSRLILPSKVLHRAVHTALVIDVDGFLVEPALNSSRDESVRNVIWLDWPDAFTWLSVCDSCPRCFFL